MDFDLSDLNNLSQSYIKAIVDDVRLNPKIKNGMIVRIYSYDDPTKQVDLGVVIKSKWSHYYQHYVHDVQTHAGLIKNVHAGVMERFTATGPALRYALHAAMIDGGMHHG